METSDGKPPIILVKPERIKEKQIENVETDGSPPKTEKLSMQPPSFIIKSRDGENKKEPDNIAGGSYMLTKSGPLACTDLNSMAGLNLQIMKSSCKLIDSFMYFYDDLSDHLQDQVDYLVVGCLGLQNTGKSTIMSLLAGASTSDERNLIEVGEHATDGIDAYVMPERVILLDCQPLLSPSVMDRLMQLDKKLSIDFGSTENALEIHSLQLAAFLFSVCHIVIIVQDWFLDSFFIRFLLTADMLRPMILPSSGEEPHDNQVKLLFLHNKASPDYFLSCKISLMKETYQCILENSHMKLNALSEVESGLFPKSEDSINLFVLPDFKKVYTSNEKLPFDVNATLSDHITSLRQRIWNSPRHKITSHMLTEKSWLAHAAKMWDAIKKSTLYLEYSRLLP